MWFYYTFLFQLRKSFGWKMNDYYCWKDGVSAVCKTTGNKMQLITVPWPDEKSLCQCYAKLTLQLYQ